MIGLALFMSSFKLYVYFYDLILDFQTSEVCLMYRMRMENTKNRIIIKTHKITLITMGKKDENL